MTTNFCKSIDRSERVRMRRTNELFIVPLGAFLTERLRRAIRMASQRLRSGVLAALVAGATWGFAMSKDDPLKLDDGEGMSMFLRRTRGAETISADIALRLAEMVFNRIYGEEYMDARSPLIVSDRGDRWEVRSREGIPAGERLQMIIVKSNGRILDIFNY